MENTVRYAPSAVFSAGVVGFASYDAGPPFHPLNIFSPAPPHPEPPDLPVVLTSLFGSAMDPPSYPGAVC